MCMFHLLIYKTREKGVPHGVKVTHDLKVTQTTDQHQFSAAPSDGESSVESDVSHGDCRETFLKDRDRNLPADAQIKETWRAKVRQLHSWGARHADRSGLAASAAGFLWGKTPTVQKQLTVFTEQN